jgi:hypothetical protein
MLPKNLLWNNDTGIINHFIKAVALVIPGWLPLCFAGREATQTFQLQIFHSFVP